ncbi:hypothetical protein CDAR_496831 [Caerostris darwini]|uniref:Uncharacterized protein n=1 Tax=Caerostris darwini TaxID=1538125 RepID=A0AAV4U547_9ARAC|nr:hypothetical protein CDAR_496831 [Caerostris darwini]
MDKIPSSLSAYSIQPSVNRCLSHHLATFCAPIQEIVWPGPPPPHVIAADLIKRHTERNNSLRSPSSGRSAAAKYTETGSCWAKVVPPGRTVNTKQTTQVARGGGRREGGGGCCAKTFSRDVCGLCSPR